jgi:hypothetical protein
VYGRAAAVFAGHHTAETTTTPFILPVLHGDLRARDRRRLSPTLRHTGQGAELYDAGLNDEVSARYRVKVEEIQIYFRGTGQ